MKRMVVLKRFLIFLTIYLCNIYSSIITKPIRSELKMHQCVQTDIDIANTDKSQRLGFLLNDLLDSNQDSYKAFSIGLWYKVTVSSNDWKHIFGICDDFYADTLVQTKNALSMILQDGNQNVAQSITFQANSNDNVAVQVSKNKATLGTISNVWRSAIMHYLPIQKKAYLKIKDYTLDKEYDFELTLKTQYNVHKNLNSAYVNLDHGNQIAGERNSCSNHKDVQFHYSINQEYAIDVIQDYQFNSFRQGIQNFYYFPFKLWQNDKQQIIQIELLQTLKNFYDLKENSGVNGLNTSVENVDVNSNQFDQFFYSLKITSGKVLLINLNQIYHSILFSFIIDFKQNEIQNGLQMFQCGNFKITLVLDNDFNVVLSITIDNVSNTNIRVGSPNLTHTLLLKKTGISLEQTQIFYYADDYILGEEVIVSKLQLDTQLMIGNNELSDSTFDSFIIRDLFIFKNADAIIPSYYEDNTEFILDNCKFYAQFAFDRAFCLVCPSDYYVSFNGICQTNIPINESMNINNLIQGSKMRSLIEGISSSTENSLKFVHNKNSDFDFLLIGYFKLKEWLGTQKYTSLVFFEVAETQNEWFYFLNLYLIDEKTIELKQTFDKNNIIQQINQSFGDSIIDQWMIFGVGYKSQQKKAYLVYSDIVSYGISYLELVNTVSIDSRVTKLNICIRCTIPNPTKYSPFIGDISSVKLIEGFNDYTNLLQFQFINENIMSNSLSNSNYKNLIKNKDIYTFCIDPEISFKCNNDYYFFEGICVDKNQCSKLIRNTNQLGELNSLYVDEESLSCNECSSNCLTCSNSADQCVTCRNGFVLVGTECKTCDQFQFYDVNNKACQTSCQIGTDNLNKMCVSSFDQAQHSALPLLNLQTISDTQGFQIFLNNQVQEDQFVKCQVNSPYNYFMFYGGSSLSSNHIIKKIWNDLPNNYLKEVSFYITLYDSTDENDIFVTINGQIPTLQTESKQLLKIGKDICEQSTSDKIQSVIFVKYTLLDNNNNLELSISSQKNGFAVRSINITVKKCHHTCKKCKGGPNQWNCTSCESKNGIKMQNQCVCSRTQYAKYDNTCYSSPCFECVKCTLSQCSQCNDIGKCIKCKSGYLIQDGQCVKNCKQLYTKDGITQFCYKFYELGLQHFGTSKVSQYLEFWTPNFSINRNNYINCYGVTGLQKFGNDQYYTLNVQLELFKSQYRGYYFDMTLLIIDQVGTNEDLRFYDDNIQVSGFDNFSFVLFDQGCASGWADNIEQRAFSFFKSEGSLNFKTKSFNGEGFNQAKGVSFGSFKIYFILNEPLCIKYNQVSKTKVPKCSACDDNSELNSQTFKCSCKDGYFYNYDDTLNASICFQCNQTCKKCTGPSVFDCNGCADGFVFDGLICTNQCAVGQYKDTILCQNCHSDCLECSGPTNSECTSCSVEKVMYFSMCYNSCTEANPNTVFNDWSKTCELSREKIGELLFSSKDSFQKTFYDEYQISNNLSSDYVYLCNNINMLGIYSGQMSILFQNIIPHQIIKLKFQVYFISGCIECKITVSIWEGDSETSIKSEINQVNISEVSSCDDQQIHKFQTILNNQEIDMSAKKFKITIKNSQDVDFAINNIQLNAITCHQTCKTCTGPASNECVSCFPGSKLDQNTNICKCEDLYSGFQQTTNNCSEPFGCMECLPCQAPCITCFKNDSQSCNSCESDMFYYKSTCLDQCPLDITISVFDPISGNTECKLCPSPCSTCNFEKCLSCIQGYVYVKDQKLCLQSCPNYYYLEPIDRKECYQCDTKCSMCQDKSNNCLTCADGYYMNTEKNECLECNPHCKTCFGPTNKDCIYCSEDKIQFQPDKNLYSYYCSSNCDEVFGFFKGINENNQEECKECYQNCLSCNSENEDSCTKCMDGYILIDGYCIICNSQCYTCNGITEIDCTSCISPNFLYFQQCISKCPDSYFEQINKDGTQECAKCPAECRSCKNPNECTLCQIGYYMKNKKCNKCDDNCQVCYGVSGEICIKCSKGYFLQGVKCVEQCQIVNGIGYYGETGSRVCKQCDQSCLECQNEYSYTCNSCKDGQYLLSGFCQECPKQSKTCIYDDKQKAILSKSCEKGYFYYLDECIKDCPKGLFNEEQSLSCKLCNAACQECKDSSTDQCQSCNYGYIWIYPSSCKPCTDFLDFCENCSSQSNCIQCPSDKILFQGQCLKECDKSKGYYRDKNTCQSCIPPCSQCDSKNNCTQCIQGFIASQNKCIHCHVQCKSCSGLTDQDCTSCQEGFYLQDKQQGKSICQVMCDISYYADNTTLLCKKCDISCKLCKNSFQCISCKLGYYKPDGNDLCLPCNPLCKDCVSEDKCILCQPGNFLLNNDCVSQCLDGQVVQNNICVPCHVSCKTCDINQIKCTTCYDGFYLDGNICKSCELKCSSCISLTQCTSCIKGINIRDDIYIIQIKLNKIKQQGYFHEDNQCKEKCQISGYYGNDQTQKCEKCDPLCKECVNSSQRDCLSCNSGYYFSPLNTVGNCIACDPSCLECFGLLNTQCTKCQKGVKQLDANTCISCPKNQYFELSTQTCQQCSNLCDNCFGPSSNNCLTCRDSYFIDNNTNICSKCPKECTNCFNNEICTSCQTGYSLLGNSRCVSPCPDQMRDLNGICLCHVTCSKCQYDVQENKSICLKCQNNELLLFDQNPYCILFKECKKYRDMINYACVDECPSETRFIDLDSLICMNSFCSLTQYTHKVKYCVSQCFEQYFPDKKTRTCKQCNLKCQICSGPTENECSHCTSENFYHPEITACKDQCLPGFVQLTTEKICTICKVNCKFCISKLVLFEGNCLQNCPVGYALLDQICIYSPNANVRISNVEDNQIISINSDFEVKADLFATSAVQSIVWTMIESFDTKFQSDFDSISSNSLSQVIPFILLTPKNIFTLKITVTLSDGTIVSDKVTIQNQDIIQDGKFSVNQTSGQSFKTLFVFTISDWSYGEELYFDLNFYELQGVQQPNISDQPSSSSQNNFDFVKEKLFKLYEKNLFITEIQIPIQFQLFDSDVNLICELKIFTEDGKTQSYKYLIIQLNSYTPSNKIKTVKDQLSYLKSQSFNENTQLQIFSYSFLLQKLVQIDQEKLENLNTQKNLRSQARLAGVQESEIQTCDKTVDCFGQGSCVQNTLYKEYCFCEDGYFGMHCEWNQDQYSLIVESYKFIKQTFSDNQISQMIQIQVIENLSSYFTAYFLNNDPITFFFERFGQLLTSYISKDIGQVSGQIIQRSLNLITSKLQEMKYNVFQFIQYGYELQSLISKNLNIGEKLITTSDANESIQYPFLVKDESTSSSNSGSRMRRLRKYRLLQSENSTSKQSFPMSFGELTVSFPPEVIKTNQKQVIQTSKWKKNPRENPLAITQSISISVSSGGQETPVNNLSQPIILTIPKTIPSPISPNPESISCTYFDEATNSFKSDGCTFVKETILSIVCSCIHLTDFTAQVIPDFVKGTQKISDFTETLETGNKLLKLNASKKFVVTTLPSAKLGKILIIITFFNLILYQFKLGQRSVSLVNQLNILQSGSALNLVKRSTIILFENEFYEYSDYVDEDKISITLDQKESNINVDESIIYNKIEIIFYLNILFIVAFLLTMRSSITFNFISLSDWKIQLYEANYFEDIIESLMKKPEQKIKKVKNVLKTQESQVQDSQSINDFKYSDNKNIKQFTDSSINMQNNGKNHYYNQTFKNEIKTYDKLTTQSSVLVHEDIVTSQNQITLETEEDNQLISGQNHTQIFPVSISLYTPIRKSIFSSKFQALENQLHTINTQEASKEADKQEEICIDQDYSLQKKNIGRKDILQNKYNVKNQNHSSKRNRQPKDLDKKLNIIAGIEENTYHSSIYEQSTITDRDVKKHSHLSQFHKKSIQNKQSQSKLFVSMNIQTQQDGYESHAQNTDEKTIDPRYQSIRNVQQITRILDKLKRNYQRLNDLNDVKSEKNSKSHLFQSTEKIKSKKYIVHDNHKFNKKMKSKPQNEKLKQNEGYKFIVSLNKQKEAEIQINQLQKEKANLQQQLINNYQLIDHNNKNNQNDILNKQQCYQKLSNDQIIFNESKLCINLKQKDNQKAINLDINKKYLKRKEQNNQLDEYQKDVTLIIQSIDQVIKQKQEYINFIDNILDNYLNISSKNIFQIYSLLQHDTKFLSNRLTKCIYFICQVIIAITAQIVFVQDLDSYISLNTFYGIVDLYVIRILVIAVMSYTIPYFIFGSLTNIFAQSSKQIQQIDFRSINQLRRYYIMCYIFIGLIQISLYLTLIFYYSQDSFLYEHFSFTKHTFEVIASLIFNMLIIDSIFYCIFTLLDSSSFIFSNRAFNTFLACRGYYYYKGFDNILVYEQFFLAQAIESI